MTSSRVTRSALWAAYGDALGFITEFRDASAIQRKFSVAGVTQPIAWERRVGGRFGPTVELPIGCYSDDTQLRLATSRSIRGDGAFDVEAFAKVELPVLLAYHLGAGRGTKAAADNLERKEVAWYSNFFSEPAVNYFHSGGNGAAMRIQPHVWARSSGYNEPELVLDVLRNAITTHGHPRGFLGAVFHAQCLAFAFRETRVAGPEEWLKFVDAFEGVADIMSADEHLDRVWRPTWERRGGQSLVDAIRQVQGELQSDLKVAVQISSSAQSGQGHAYRQMLQYIGGFAKETVGSGTKTALAAAVLCHLYRDAGAEDAVVAAANEFGSDTDTIATMAGAIMGCLAKSDPPVPPLDAEYISDEAERLTAISNRKLTSSFAYPDLLHWRSPKTQLDAVGQFDGAVAVAGLGFATSQGRVAPAGKQNSDGWEWFRLAFGQTVLVKRRATLPKLPPYAMPKRSSSVHEPRASIERAPKSESLARIEPGRHAIPSVQTTLFETPATVRRHDTAGRRSLDDLSTEAIRSGFRADIVGQNLIDLVDRSPSPIEDAIAYAAILAKARVARAKASRRNEEVR